MIIEEVMLSYTDLYDLWESHPEWWFSGVALPHLYSYALLPPPPCTAPRKELIGYIISRDQIPRNQTAREINLTHQVLWAVDVVVSGLGVLTAFEFVFVYLPLRHIGLCNRVVIDAVKWVEEHGCPPLMKRFLIATLQRCPHTETLCSTVVKSTYDDLRNTFADVLEPIILSYKPPVKLGLPKLPKNKNLVLSLSGGVDSMVCMDLLIKAGVKIKAAVHINYMNRGDIAIREQEFVEAYCRERGVEIYVRRISEIQRAFCVKHGLREGYEIYTKNARFAAYKEAGADIVVLGHNKDDAFENIITNIKRGQKHDNLAGIGLHGDWDKDIALYRPLVHVSKEDIFEYAHQKGLPYLKDTTSKWCERWKVRYMVAPAIHHMDAYEGFFILGDICKELSSVFDMYVLSLAKELKDNGKICIDESHPLVKSHFFAWRFWNNVYGVHVSRKSIGEYLRRLDGIKRKPGCTQRIVFKIECQISITFQNDSFLAMTI
jgi:tRNA(Ile)-lysidine synthetase-like protein